MDNCYYAILGIEKNAEQDEIKKAFRKLSMKWHPDRNNQSAESTKQFQSISTAYSTLSDPQKKKSYDIQSNLNRFNTTFINPDDILNMFFNNHEGGNIFRTNKISTPTKPSIIIKTISITLEQSYYGYSYPLKIERYILINNEKQLETETIYVNIERGADDNEIIVIQNKGNINNGIKGDVKVKINIINNTVFERKGLDIIYKRTITLKEALCGFSINIEVFTKRFKINNTDKIIHPGFTKCINGMGMTRNKNIGNMFIVFNIIFPDQISNDNKDKLCAILP